MQGQFFTTPYTRSLGIISNKVGRRASTTYCSEYRPWGKLERENNFYTVK